MEICWDNIEGIKLSKNGFFIKNHSMTYIYKDSCVRCGEPYLTEKHAPSDFCGRSCALSGNNHPGYGRHLSKEHKEKLSIAFTGEKNHFYGKKHSGEVRKTLKELATGRRHSKKTLRKMSIAQTGLKRFSKEYKKQLSIKFSGPGNPQWQGGKSFEPYCINWTKEFKNYIKERDGYMCLNPYCYRSSNKLIVHHINYTKKDCNQKNLITLCDGCNARANIDREWHTSWYRAIMNRRYGFIYG